MSKLKLTIYLFVLWVIVKKKIKLFKVITILVSNNNKSSQQIKNKQKMPREQASAAMHGNVFKQIRNTTVNTNVENSSRGMIIDVKYFVW